MLTSEQFERIRKLALRLAGTELFARHREVLDRRIHRLGIHAEAAVDALLQAGEAGEPRAVRQLIGMLTTNFSGFFRHPRHFELAAECAREAVHRRGTARLWSAAAATGEEAYSLAMTMIEVFQRNDPPVTILATDIDEDALAIARRGEYAEPAMSALAAGYRTRFFGPAAKARPWAIRPAVRSRVEFRELNLTDLVWPIAGPFDVVFCRNVLMYLETNHRYAVLERMASVLAPDGMLLLDPTEHLGKAGHLFAPGTNGVYRGRTASRRPIDRLPADRLAV